MTQEFNLSDKRYSSMDGWDSVNKEEIKSWHYQEEDVKEFIKKLKEEIKTTQGMHNECSLEARKIIDKLAGKSLT
jgi:adenylosuccinate synthase